MAKKAKITMEDISRYSDECFKQVWDFFEKEYIETGKTDLWKRTQELERQEKEPPVPEDKRVEEGNGNIRRHVSARQQEGINTILEEEMETKSSGKPAILSVQETNEIIAKWVRVMDGGKATAQDIKMAEGIKNLIATQIRKENILNQYLSRIKSREPIATLETGKHKPA